MFMSPWYPPITIRFELTNKLPYKKLQYPTYMKDIGLNAYNKIFKKAIKASEEIVEMNIVKLFGFTLRNNISE